MVFSSNGFLSGDEIFAAFLDEDGRERSGYFYVVEVGQSAVVIKAKSGAVIFIPVSRVLKLKKKGGLD